MLAPVPCFLVLSAGVFRGRSYGYDGLGLALGGLIAAFAIWTTTFEWRDNDWFYRPHPWIGAILLVLFIGRIGYRVYQDSALLGGKGAKVAQLAAYSNDPATNIILFALIGYYIIYYTFLLRREWLPGN